MLQTGTVNDVISITLYASDNVTPANTGGYTSAVVELKAPDGTISAVGTTITITTGTSTVLSFNTSATMFTQGGFYQAQPILTFPGGTITKFNPVNIPVNKAFA